MGQEFNVVRCYSCSVFQSHQVRKDKKFVCKLCGEKQSVRKEYGRGCGKDCRVHVQKLNSLRRNLEEEREAVLEAQLEEECEGQALEEECEGQFSLHMTEDGESGSTLEGNGELGMSVGGARVSKWSKYLSSDSDSEEENNTRYTRAAATARGPNY